MPIKFEDMVAGLIKDPEVIKKELTTRQVNLIHMFIGIVGEVGELGDALKKNIIYGLPLDLENVKEELGDLDFYEEGLRQEVGLTQEEIREANITKLSKRYPHLTYTNAAAVKRADKE